MRGRGAAVSSPGRTPTDHPHRPLTFWQFAETRATVNNTRAFPGRLFDRWTNQNAPFSANTAANRANFATHVWTIRLSGRCGEF